MAKEPRNPSESGGEQFAALYDRFYGKIVNFFQWRGISVEESRDLAQETFLRAYRGWAGFRYESSPETWFYEIAMNIFKNRFRDQNAPKNYHVAVSLTPKPDAEESDVPGMSLQDRTTLPDEKAIESEARERLRSAVRSLPPQRRQCMELRLLDLEYHEIAEIMGVSIETVKSHLYQARESLRKPLGDPGKK